MVGTQGRGLGTETETEAMKECCVLACFSWLVQLAFLYSPGPPA